MTLRMRIENGHSRKLRVGFEKFKLNEKPMRKTGFRNDGLVPIGSMRIFRAAFHDLLQSPSIHCDKLAKAISDVFRSQAMQGRIAVERALPPRRPIHNIRLFGRPA